MTSHREDYLKTIYAANVSRKRLTNKMLADELNVSAPSVSEMLGKLVDSKRIKADKELGYALAEAGVLEAERLIRKHRLWEVFLVNYLGYSWDDVNEDAEILEHATSDLLAARLSAFLENPETCPHGGPIYGNIAAVELPKRVALERLQVGQTGVIREVSDQKKFLSYLRAKALHLGSVLKVLAVDEYDGTMRVSCGDAVIELSARAAQDIYVEHIAGHE